MAANREPHPERFPRDDRVASRLQLPPGGWATVLDCLSDRFPAISRGLWQQRMARGDVTDAQGRALEAAHPFRVGLEIRYFREVPDEAPIPFHERILHVDDHLLVADKPHFLPVAPAGDHVEQTLLMRLRRGTGNHDLVPLHRIDRATAGLVLFSVNPRSRAQYQALFREGRIAKAYEALAPALPGLAFPHVRRSRLVRGEPFFRMREADGAANSETRIDVLDANGPHWRYRLQPVTGRKHQLRVHMAALGAAIVNDAWYPRIAAVPVRPDFARPLQLLAKRLSFVDPLDGEPREFTSLQAISHPLP